MSSPAVANRKESLAIAFQEPLTAIERVRANRQSVSDAESFRSHLRDSLKTADRKARECGYSPEDTRLGMFAVVAFLDESILNTGSPVFADWPRKPLQEEIFGGHQAGEIFFQNIARLMEQSDSAVLADVLEVYRVCILLGYGGRYSVAGKAELKSISDSIADRIRRIRGNSPELSPSWAPAGRTVARSHGDPWIRRLIFAAIACAGLMILLFVIFKVTLSSGQSAL